MCRNCITGTSIGSSSINLLLGNRSAHAVKAYTLQEEQTTRSTCPPGPYIRPSTRRCRGHERPPRPLNGQPAAVSVPGGLSRATKHATKCPRAADARVRPIFLRLRSPVHVHVTQMCHIKYIRTLAPAQRQSARRSQRKVAPYLYKSCSSHLGGPRGGRPSAPTSMDGSNDDHRRW